MEECYLIDLKPQFFNQDKVWSIVSSNGALQTTWAKLMLAACEGGATIKGRPILATSLLVDTNWIDDDKSLERLSSYEWLTFKKANPPSKPRPKLVEAPKSRGSEASSHTLQPTDTFIEFDAISWFTQFWELYPSRNGQKLRKAEAKSWFVKNITNKEDALRITQAVQNYNRSDAVIRGFAKDAINFLGDWEEWVNWQPSSTPSRLSQAYINKATDDKLVL